MQQTAIETNLAVSGPVAAASGDTTQPRHKLAYTKEEAAHLLSISVRSVDYLIGSGDLKVRRVGRRVLIPRQSLLQFLRQDHPGRLQ